ncbi:T9SS type A sorting domain-containing protein, partial [bacterium]|nr:T9SS type A sorting domain-containing protein [bacterium]
RPPPDSYEKSYAVDHTPYLLSVPLSINESENTPIELDMTVYPNPANARFTVELPEEMTDGTVTLYAINGEVVDEEIINGKEVTFDVSDLPSGTYLIRAQDGFNQAKRKVSFLK